MNDKPTNDPPADQFDHDDPIWPLTSDETEAMNNEDAAAITLIAARMCANAIMLVHNALATDSRLVVIPMPDSMPEYARRNLASALETAAEAFQKIEDRNTDQDHTFDTAVRRLGLMQEEQTK